MNASRRRRLLQGLPLALLLTLLSHPLLAAKTWELKFATLAPPGSTWATLIEQWAQTVAAESDGRLVFRLYPGGVQGDEPDVLKKIRFGQLHGGAFTGYGIGRIYSPARVLELPFLFDDIDEIDYVRARLMPDIEQGFRDNGYVMLGWMELGYVYFFSRQPLRSLEDLARARLWHWQGDPVGRAFFSAGGLSPIPLSIIDVYTSLSTGVIDTVYAPPQGALALQWDTKTGYITNLPMANGIGSLLVSRRFFQGLPQDLQLLLIRTGQAISEQLIAATRRDNATALQTLKQRGLQLIEGDTDLLDSQIDTVCDRAGQSLVENGYIPRSMMDRVQALIREYRQHDGDTPAHVDS